MSTKNIYSALKTQLVNNSFGVDMVLPNTEYDAVTDTPYAKVYFLPATPTASELGTGRAERVSGVLQLTLYFPVEQGDGSLMDTVDSLKSAFVRGVTFEYGESCVRIESAGANGSADVDGAWFTQAFDIEFSAFESV